MANIDIQRKSSSQALWWVLGILALVVLLVWLFGWMDPGRTTSASPSHSPEAAAPGSIAASLRPPLTHL